MSASEVITGSTAGTARQRDRRRGLTELVATLSRAIREGADAALIRGAFEEQLRRAVRVRTIRLREGTSRWGARASESNGGLESMSFEVAGPHPASPGTLEASFDAGSPMGEWDFQLLGIAAHIGALVLELDRARVQLARAVGAGSGPGAASGAAPGAIRSRREPATLIGSSPVMAELRSRIERVAATDFTVLLEGESGVGKELVARQIHESSRRRNGPFVALNCAALVDTLLEAELFGIEDRTATGVRGRRGKFEHADGGTLFLDEVSDLSLSAQAKLLRAIQDLAVERVGGNGAHRVDIRIVAATNRPLADVVERRLFRPDLFYRLSGVDIHVPALRQRRDDIIELAQHFLDRHRATRRLMLSDAAAEALLIYSWPGNVRELERLMERAVALAETSVIELDDLPPAVRGAFTSVLMPSLRRHETMRTWGSRYARLVLQQCGGNKREAGRVLGISYHTLIAYLRYTPPDGSDSESDPVLETELPEPAPAESDDGESESPGEDPSPAGAERRSQQQGRAIAPGIEEDLSGI
jgi:two-component system response regulator HydG